MALRDLEEKARAASRTLGYSVSPEEKRSAWVEIGRSVEIARKEFGVGDGASRSGAPNRDRYQAWLKKAHLDKISERSLSEAIRVAKSWKEIAAALTKHGPKGIPQSWVSPGRLLRAMRAIERGEEPASAEKSAELSTTTVEQTIRNKAKKAGISIAEFQLRSATESLFWLREMLREQITGGGAVAASTGATKPLGDQREAVERFVSSLKSVSGRLNTFDVKKDDTQVTITIRGTKADPIHSSLQIWFDPRDARKAR